MPSLRHRLNYCVYEAPDVPGQWIAHCLELDLVTQGNDPAHAFEMLNDAIATLVSSATDLPILDFRMAPPEAFRDFVTAPLSGYLDIEVRYHWDSGESRPRFEVVSPQVGVAR